MPNRRPTRPFRRRNLGTKPAPKSKSALRAEQLESRLLLSVNDLVWNGTSGADQVLFEQIDATTIRVTETLLNGAAVNNVVEYSDIDGRVIASGLGGNDLLDASGLTTTASTLDGGAGSNTLRGGAAADLLIGGTNGGEGAQASHTIVGGAGDDTIYGNAQVGAEGSTGGNHLILGGAGNDTIYGAYGSVEKSNGDPSNGGEGGQNLIVGGAGSDTIYASQTGDGAEGGHGSILVAGDSTLDEAELSTVLSEWTSTRTLSEKLDNIAGVGSGPRNNGDNFLQIGVTLFSDHTTDQLYSDTNGAANWLIDTAGVDSANRVKAADVQDDVQVGQAIWINPAGGFWDEAANWQDGYLPGPNDIAVLNASSNTITFRSGTVTVQGIQAASPLKVTGGSLTVSGDWEMHQSLELTAGTLTVDGNLVMHNTLKLARTLTEQGFTPNVVYTVTPSDLYVAGNLEMHDTLIFNGGTLHNATLFLLDGAQVSVPVMYHGGVVTIFFGQKVDQTVQEPSGSLDHVTIASNFEFSGSRSYTVGTSTLLRYQFPYLTVTNGLTINANLTLGSNSGYGGLRFIGSSAQMLDGVGSVTFGPHVMFAQNPVTRNSLAGNFTIGSNILVHGSYGKVTGIGTADVVINQGTIAADVGGADIWLGETTCSFVNQGLIQAAAAATLALIRFSNEAIINAAPGSTLSLGSTPDFRNQNAWTNSGTITAVGAATLNLGGSLNAASMGSITMTGPVNLIGVYTGDLTLGVTTGSWRLLGGELRDGILTETGGARLMYADYGALNNMTLLGPLDLSQDNNANLTILNNLVVGGSILVGNAAGTTSATLFFGQTSGPYTVPANLDIVLGGSASNQVLSGLTNPGDEGILTIPASVTIRGKSGTIATKYPGGGQIIVNQGSISADVAGGTISLGPNGGFINQGTVQAAGGNIIARFTAPNEGIIAAGAGNTVTINNGNYAQAASGTTRIEVAGTGPAQFGKVIVNNGAAFLAGLLQIIYAGGYSPANNDEFNVLSAFSVVSVGINGAYDTIDGSGVTFTPTYGPTNLTLTAVVP